MSACKESESCCNHYKDLQNRLNDVRQNWKSRGQTCVKQLESLFEETSQKMGRIQQSCSSLTVKNPCMTCFACRANELNFCSAYKATLGCSEFSSLISLNGSLQDSDETASTTAGDSAALLNRAAVRETDRIETVDSVAGNKHCL